MQSEEEEKFKYMEKFTFGDYKQHEQWGSIKYILGSDFCHFMKYLSSECNRDTPLNSNDIVITSNIMGKYSKTVDDSQYRVDFIVFWSSNIIVISWGMSLQIFEIFKKI